MKSSHFPGWTVRFLSCEETGHFLRAVTELGLGKGLQKTLMMVGVLPRRGPSKFSKAMGLLGIESSLALMVFQRELYVGASGWSMKLQMGCFMTRPLKPGLILGSITDKASGFHRASSCLKSKNKQKKLVCQ